MKRIFSIFLPLFLIVAGACAQTYWNGTSNKVFSGSGTQADPYLISTPEQLAGLAERTNVDKEDFAGQYIKLTADIYLTDFTSTDTANWKKWEPIAHTLMVWGEETDYGYFRGTFDGDGHTIYNMYYGGGEGWADDYDPNDLDIDIGSYDFSVLNKALFGNIEGASLLNIRMVNARVAAQSNQALLVLNTDANCVVRNCHVQGEMRTGVAGLVNTNKGLVENCSVDITSYTIGGAAFVGTNDSSGVIRNCNSTGTMHFTRSDGCGFVGTNYGLVEKCTSDVTLYAGGGGDIGVNAAGGHTFRYRSGAGFVMYNGGLIRECAAFGDVSSDGQDVNYIWYSGAAGFAYRNWGGRIESCYCTGALRDMSEDTGGAGDPNFAHFCYDNGYDAAHINDDMARGDIINCYSTSTIYHHDAETNKNNIHAFVASYHGYGGFYADLMEPSIQIGYFNQDGLPTITGQSGAVWHGIGKTLAQMQSQAFVDTLNMLASFMGLSQWELRDGLPRPTGVYSTNTSIMFGGGDGTKANPYIIATKQHLENLRWLVDQGLTFKNTYFLQTADIALNVPQSEWEETAPSQWKPIGSPRSNPWYSSSVINEFKGVYDGGFHEIQNMYINNLLDKQGLFGRIAQGAQLRNLGVTDAYIRSANHGVIAGEIAAKPIVVQCWTSGNIATQGQYAGNQGGLIGNMAGGSYVLNCGTSVQMINSGNAQLAIYHTAVYGGFNVWAQDTLVNFLYTGNGYGYSSFQHRENFFADKEKAQIEYLGDGTEYGDPNCTLDSTRWMQSKDLVNIYNYSVARWNERHAGNDTLLLHYWEWREGDYPRVSPNASFRPPVTISFNSNGGSAVTTKYVYPNSEVLPPQRPLRSGYIFAGWYKDEALTQFFDWKTERPATSMTLYARWHEDKRFDIDLTPFQNEFAKTYHIKTAAQLRGFAAMQNGLYSWTDSVYCNDDNKSYAADNLTQTQAPMNFKGKKVVLDNDIVLCDTTDWQYWGRGAFGLPFIPIGWYYGINGEGDHTFYGTFDGQGHTIYGMYMEKNGTPGWNAYGGNVGLFGLVGDSAIVRNVGVAASVLDGQDYNTRGQYNDATKYWRRCGYGEQGWGHVGMLIGVTSKAIIEQCYAEGNIYGTDAKALIGTIDNSWSLHNDTISNCYSRVNVYDKYGQPEGSFGASDWSATFINCYSAGVTKGSICGCASSGYGTITYNNTYYNKELGTTKLSCDNSRGCTTNEMHAKTTYQNWDFENIWGRNDSINDGYPYLRVFYDNPPEDSQDPIIVTGITLNVTDTTLYTGQTLQMEATVLPAEAENKKVTWTSTTWGIGSSNELASEWFEMDENGLISTHVSPYNYYNGRSGQIRVIATTEEGEYTAECLLTIAQPSITILPVAYRRHGETEWKYQGLWSNTENFEYMMAAYTNIDAARTGLTWAVNNEDVYSITEMTDTILNIYNVGMKPCSRIIAYAKGSGNATITATLPNGQKGYYDSEVSRVDLVSPSYYIDIYQSPYTSWQRVNTTMGLGETQQLEVYNGYLDILSYLPAYQWSSSNPSVLTVDQNGLVTAVGVGTATITVSAVGTNVSATTETITVSVIEATGITINEGGYWDTFELYEGETKQLTATIQPENTTDKTVTWSSNNTSVATVDQNGLVTAMGIGIATITATTSNGLSNSTNIRVKAIEPTGITINENTGEIIPLYVGDTYQLSATVLPENAGNKTVRWSSDDNNIARVSSSGLVKAMGEGYVNITARTNNGLEDYITFEVIEPVVPPTYYTIRFLNWDGAELQNSQVLEGNVPVYSGATPVRPEDEQYTYSFSGWQPEIVAAIANADYTAQFTATEKTVTPPEPTYYTIRFLNYDGTELQSSQVKEGDMPVYNGTTPTKPEDEGYTYTFNGWLPAIVPAAADAIYMAQYTATPKTVYYTVTFLDWDGTELLVEQVEEGHDAHGPETDPTRDGYIFTGWSKPITNITANLIVIAQYEIIPQDVYYTIRFLNWDGAELQNGQVKEGEIPVYSGATPVRPEDGQYTYSFSGWSPAVVAASANADYTAQYTATEKPQPKEPITVRLYPGEWETVYLYAWTGSGETQPCGAWPGAAVSKDAQGWWSYTFDPSIQDVNIIWTNGAGMQTVDITHVTASTCYRLGEPAGLYAVSVIDCATPIDGQPKNYLPYGLQASVDGGMATLSWSVTDLPAYFGISVFCNDAALIDGTTLNNNTSFAVSLERYGTYTWRVCGANEMRELITDWVYGPDFEVKDPKEGIDTTPSGSPSRGEKLIINGVLYIVFPDGKAFNAQGARVK